MIVTVDDEVPSINGKLLGNNLIVISNSSLSSCIISSMIFTLIDDDVKPVGIMTLNKNAVAPAVYKITITTR